MDGEYFRNQLNDTEFISAIAWSCDLATVRIQGREGGVMLTKEQLENTIQMLNNVLEKVKSYE